MEKEKKPLLTAKTVEKLSVDDLASLEKFPAPERQQRDYTGFIYFLFYRGVVVYIGQTVQQPEERIIQHKEDKFFDSYSFMQVADGENLNEVEKLAIRTINPIYNLTCAKGEIDMYSLWNYNILVAPRKERGRLGGYLCVKVEDDGSLIAPKGNLVGWYMKEFRQKVFFNPTFVGILKTFLETNKGKEVTWVKSECRNLGYKIKSESNLLPHAYCDKVEKWIPHVIYYCYIRGVKINYLPNCIDAFVWAFYQNNQEHLAFDAEEYPQLAKSAERLKKAELSGDLPEKSAHQKMYFRKPYR